MEIIWEIVVKPAWYWLITIIPAGLGIFGAYQASLPANKQGGLMMQIYNLLPFWVWMIITMFSFIVTILISASDYVKKIRNEQKQESAIVQTASADRSGIAMQGVKDSPVNSYNNTWNPPPAGFGVPTKKEILRRISVEIQEFEDQFDSLRYKQLKNRHDEVVKAREIFDRIKTGVLRHAKIELKGTTLLTLFENLEKELNRYPIQIGMVLQHEVEREFYANADPAYLSTVIERINVNRDEMDKTEASIVVIVLQIKNFENEYNNWLMS